MLTCSEAWRVRQPTFYDESTRGMHGQRVDNTGWRDHLVVSQVMGKWHGTLQLGAIPCQHLFLRFWERRHFRLLIDHLTHTGEQRAFNVTLPIPQL